MRTTTSPTTPSELVPPIVPLHERRANIRFPLALCLQYVSIDRNHAVRGHGLTVNLSRGGVLFEAPGPLPLGLKVDLCVAWPVALNGLTGLNLWAQGRTVRMCGQLAAVQILNYEFRVSRLPEVRALQ